MSKPLVDKGRLGARLAVAGVLLAMFGAFGCSFAPSAKPLKAPDPAAIHSAEQAKLALSVSSRMRAELSAQWKREERGCYERFFVTACLERLGAAGRDAEHQLTRLEIRARTVLRELKTETDTRNEALRLAKEREPGK